MAKNIQTTCCIAGGGPAGMMLGVLLARNGVDVTVLEKHKDFLRDFRGDTIHPSTLEVIREMGLLGEFLKRPHQKVQQLTGYIGQEEITLADFSHLDLLTPYIALMPQWDFLSFLAEEGRKHPNFHLLMETRADDLIVEGGHVVGVKATAPDGEVEIRSVLTVAADGRHSTLRERAGLEVIDTGAPIDVLWMRLSRKETDPDQPLGRLDRGVMLVMLYRGDYWQCAYVIPKDGFEKIKADGLDKFRESIATIAPAMQDRVAEIKSWDDVKLLTVKIDHLTKWHRSGFLCIGDAAHAMSPVGGVGINLAVQDAVASANILSAPLGNKIISDYDLEKVQKRREWPARMTQRMQVLVHSRIFGKVLTAKGPVVPNWFILMFRNYPILRRIPAYIVGKGFRPEHIKNAGN